MNTARQISARPNPSRTHGNPIPRTAAPCQWDMAYSFCDMDNSADEKKILPNKHDTSSCHMNPGIVMHHEDKDLIINFNTNCNTKKQHYRPWEQASITMSLPLQARKGQLCPRENNQQQGQKQVNLSQDMSSISADLHCAEMILVHLFCFPGRSRRRNVHGWW